MRAIQAAGGASIVIDENNADQLGSWMRKHEDIND
jgi:hypothetical protein